jgi:tetratricopeptide (TPR) repeat protein
MSKDGYIFENYINLARENKFRRNYVKALRFYNKAYKCDEGRMDVELLLDIALLYSEIKYYSEAEGKYREIIKINPEEARAYYGIAVVYDEQENYKEAIKYYQKAISLDRQYDRAYFFLANAYDEIKKVAKYTTTNTVENGGFAEAVYKFIEF